MNDGGEYQAIIADLMDAGYEVVGYNVVQDSSDADLFHHFLLMKSAQRPYLRTYRLEYRASSGSEADWPISGQEITIAEKKVRG